MLSKDDQISGRGRQPINTLCMRRPNCSVSSLEILTVFSTHALENPWRFLEPGEPTCLCRLLGTFARLEAYKNASEPPIAVTPCGRHLFCLVGIYGKNRLFQEEGQKWVLRSQLLMSKNEGRKKNSKLHALSITGSASCFCQKSFKHSGCVLMTRIWTWTIITYLSPT